MPVVKTYQNKIDPNYFTIKQSRAKVFSNMKKGFITETPTQDLIANDSPSAEYDEDVFTIIDNINQMIEEVGILIDYYSGNVLVEKTSIFTEITKLNALISQYKTFFQLTFVNEIGSLSTQQISQVKDVIDELNDLVDEWSTIIQDIIIKEREREERRKRGEDVDDDDEDDDYNISPSKGKGSIKRDINSIINIGSKTCDKITNEIKPLYQMLRQFSVASYNPPNYDITEMEGSGRIEGSTLYGGGRSGVRHPHNQLSNSFRLHYLSSLSKRNM